MAANRIIDEDRAIVQPDGTYHYGLIRTPQEKTFAATYSLDLPEVDIAALPDSARIAEWMNVEDQGQQGACAGHARTSAEELAIYRQTQGEIRQLSRQFAYITAQKIDGIRGDTGSTIEGNAKASQTVGTCLESFAPYTGSYYTQFKPEAYENAKGQQLQTWQRLENYDQCLRWNVHGVGGIAIGIGWNGNCTPDSRGCIEQYRSGGGGHSLAILDWNKKFLDSAGRPYLWLFNSWSKRWGKDGCAYIHPRVIDYWCKNETVIGYSDMKLADIKPRPFNWGSIWS